MIFFNRYALIVIRALVGMSQLDLARADGRSNAYISQLESGDRANPSMETITSLAAGLGIDPRALYVEVPS